MAACDKGEWVPSIAPAHCGKPHLHLKPSVTLLRLSPVGNFIYFFKRTMFMDLTTLWKIVWAVERPMLNNKERLLNSMLVASFHNVIITLFSTGIDRLNLVVSFFMKDLSWSHKRVNVCLDIRKLTTQSFGDQLFTSLKISHVLFFTHTVFLCFFLKLNKDAFL